jgi:acetyl esterase/lipase
MASPENKKLIEILWRNHPGESSYEVMKDSVDKMRANMVQMTRRFTPAPDTKIEEASAGGVPAEWVSAAGSSSEHTLLYLHGGGYVIGSPETHRGLADRISSASGARVLLLDYRLAPEARFPAALDDALAAYRWLLREGVRPERIVIAGDSAGGGLTLATLAALRDAGDPLPAAAVPISPWTDLEGTGDSVETRKEIDPMVEIGGLLGMAKLYLGDADPQHPLASPLHCDPTGFPPLLIHVGDYELLLDDSTRFAERAKAAGVATTLEVWPEMVHVWHCFAPMLPEGQQAIERIGQFAKEHWV